MTDDPVALFLQRGGAIVPCPAAAAAPGSAEIGQDDREKIAEHDIRRKASVTFAWGHQKERRRSQRKGVK